MKEDQKSKLKSGAAKIRVEMKKGGFLSSQVDLGIDSTTYLVGQGFKNIIDVSRELTRWLKAIPPKYLLLYLKAARKKASPRDAIKSHCQRCVGYEDVTRRVIECSTWSCSLWPYRPYQDHNSDSENSQDSCEQKDACTPSL